VPKAEPWRAHPYIYPAGYWAIGYGHLCDRKHPPITEAEAVVYLAQDLKMALVATLCYCPVLATEPVERLAAIVDFTFNLGAGRLQTSTLRRRVNQRDWPAATTELRRWVYGGGRPLAGLVARREAEIHRTRANRGMTRHPTSPTYPFRHLSATDTIKASHPESAS